MEIKEVTIVDIILLVIFGIPTAIIGTRLWVIKDATFVDSTLITVVFILTLGITTYFFCKIIAFIINWWSITNAKEMRTEAIIKKSFLKTKLTIQDLVRGNNSFEKSFDGFEIEYSRNIIEKIIMSTRRDIATNTNEVEIQVFNDTYYIKTKITDQELLQNNMFKVGQKYRLFNNNNKLYIEKNRIIYILRKGKLTKNYKGWISCENGH